MILLHVYIPFAVMLLHTDFERLNNRPIFESKSSYFQNEA